MDKYKVTFEIDGKPEFAIMCWAPSEQKADRYTRPLLFDKSGRLKGAVSGDSLTLRVEECVEDQGGEPDTRAIAESTEPEDSKPIAPQGAGT